MSINTGGFEKNGFHFVRISLEAIYYSVLTVPNTKYTIF